jgi:hypothetical protein
MNFLLLLENLRTRNLSLHKTDLQSGCQIQVDLGSLIKQKKALHLQDFSVWLHLYVIHLNNDSLFRPKNQELKLLNKSVSILFSKL